jgi:probable addiction module antidote protein
MSKGITMFDLSEFLDSDDAICEYLTQVIDNGDMEEAKRALGYVAKEKGWSLSQSKPGEAYTRR